MCRNTRIQVSDFSKSKLTADVVFKSEAAIRQTIGDQQRAGKLQIGSTDESGDSFVLARVTASATQTEVIGDKNR